MTRKLTMGFVLGALCVALVSVPAQADDQDRVSATEKGSVLVFAKVELRWFLHESMGWIMHQDTFLDLTNDYPGSVYVKMYYVNGDEALEADPGAGERAHPGCNHSNLGRSFTSNQPLYWSMGTGAPLGLTPFAEALDPGDPPGRPSADGSGDRVMRGYVVAFAIDEVTGHSIRHNHLKGDAMLVNWRDGAAWEYNAFAFRALDADQGAETGDNGDVDDEVTLRLDGSEYDYCPSQLVLDFYAVGSTCLSRPAPPGAPTTTVTVDTDVTLLPMIIDVRQDAGDDTLTKARFTIWDMNENMLTSQTRCIECWDQALLSSYDAPNHFELIATDKGKAVIQGEASTQCPGSVEAPLLGLAAKILTFERGVMHGMAGMNLVGKGVEAGSIKFDLADPPEEKNAGGTEGTLFTRPSQSQDLGEVLGGAVQSRTR